MEAWANTGSTYNQGAIRAALREMQKRGKTTYAQIAADAGISRTTVSQFVNKEMAISERQAEAIAQAMHFEAQDEYEGIHMANTDAQRDESASAEIHAETPADVVNGDAGRYAGTGEKRIIFTQQFQDASGWLSYVREKRKMGVLFGHPGTGKTTILKHFAQSQGAKYIECWPGMRLGDVLTAIALASDIEIHGDSYSRGECIRRALEGRKDIMLLFDEGEQLHNRSASKFDLIRKLWDNTGTPIIFAGTFAMKDMMTRDVSVAQLLRRMLAMELKGIGADEADRIIGNISIEPEAAAELKKVAANTARGGLGNLMELLELCRETAGDGRITLRMVNMAKQFKLL